VQKTLDNFSKSRKLSKEEAYYVRTECGSEEAEMAGDFVYWTLFIMNG